MNIFNLFLCNLNSSANQVDSKSDQYEINNEITQTSSSSLIIDYINPHITYNVISKKAPHEITLILTLTLAIAITITITMHIKYSIGIYTLVQVILNYEIIGSINQSSTKICNYVDHDGEDKYWGMSGWLVGFIIGTVLLYVMTAVRNVRRWDI